MEEIMRVIQIGALWNLTVNRKRVDPWVLKDEAEALYESIKVVGVKDTVARIGDSEDTISGREISYFTRAVVAFVVMLMNRWADNHESMRRLKEHFELPISIADLLASTGIYTESDSVIPILKISDVVEKIAA